MYSQNKTRVEHIAPEQKSIVREAFNNYVYRKGCLILANTTHFDRRGVYATCINAEKPENVVSQVVEVGFSWVITLYFSDWNNLPLTDSQFVADVAEVYNALKDIPYEI